MVCLIENKKNSSARFKALLKTYIVDVEADDYSAWANSNYKKNQLKRNS